VSQYPSTLLNQNQPAAVKGADGPGGAGLNRPGFLYPGSMTDTVLAMDNSNAAE
jgi:hypothetical protein